MNDFLSRRFKSQRRETTEVQPARLKSDAGL
jgi:hypothetical protein